MVGMQLRQQGSVHYVVGLQEAGTTLPELGGRRGVRPSQRARGRTAPELVYMQAFPAYRVCTSWPHWSGEVVSWKRIDGWAGLGELDKWADKGGELGCGEIRLIRSPVHALLEIC